MFIQRLVVQNFRNLNHIELETVPSFNLICGPNGAGKTSVLEAINYLALGRSFRQASAQYLIQQGQPALSVFSQIQEEINYQSLVTTIGMSRSRGDELQIKVNSDPVFRLIDLVDHICVQVIHPQGIELITKESEGRRSFIDWGVYYSDNSFKQLWIDYRKALKQRNALLRQTTTRYKSRSKRYIDSWQGERCFNSGISSDFSSSSSLDSSSSSGSTQLASSTQDSQEFYLNSQSAFNQQKQGQVLPNQQAPQGFNSQSDPNFGSFVLSGSSSKLSSGSQQIYPELRANYGEASSQGYMSGNGSLPRGEFSSSLDNQGSFNYNVQDLSPVLQAHINYENQVQQASYPTQSPMQATWQPFVNERESQQYSQETEQGQGSWSASGAGAGIPTQNQSNLGLNMHGVAANNGSLAGAGQPLAGSQLGSIAEVSKGGADESKRALGSLSVEGQNQSAASQQVQGLADKSKSTKPDLGQTQQGLRKIWSSPMSEFEIWNEQIADLSERITEMRLGYLGSLQVVLQEILDQFLPNFKLKFELYFGWDKGADLRSQLAQNLEKERGLGYTLYGCHRADLKIKNHNLAAGATLSRGQLKMLVYAMRLAQGMLLKQQTQRSCIYLIDDLNSELDDNSQRRLLNTLLECQHQVFISNIQSDFRSILIPHGRSDIKVFNLEQGRLVD